MAKGNVIKMSEAVGKVERISPSVAIDEAGNKVRTAGHVKNPGAGERTGAGRPRVFKDADDLLQAFSDYIDHIRVADFSEVPTRANFATWTGADRKTIYNTINQYFPQTKSIYSDMLADCLSEGAISGVYDRTITIFCLKNWCNWADKAENVNAEIKPTLADKDTADKLIKEYIGRQK